MREMDEQLLASNAISLKLSEKRSNQWRRYHQQIEDENKHALEAKRKMMRQEQEQEKLDRLAREKVIKDEIQREAEKEKLDELCKKSIQKKLLNAQVSYEKEVKEALQAEERYVDHLRNTLDIGADPVDYREEVKSALEHQIKEKEVVKMTEVI